MSHSKFRKNGQSLYMDNWNSAAKKYITEHDFINSLEREAIYEELTKMFQSPLILDSFGRCDECAKRQDTKRNSVP